MYKILKNNLIIDVVKELQYVRYLKESHKIIPTSSISAHGICSSKRGVYYALEGVSLPPEKSHWEYVTVFPICEAEYNILEKALRQKEPILYNTYVIDKIRNKKLSDLKDMCKEIIFEGVTVNLSDGMPHKFSLTLEDQINLNNIKNNIQNNILENVYHANGEVCKIYSKEDMMTIINAADKHIHYHTTYFNLLKYCINNIDEFDKIEAVQYGDPLTNFNLDNKFLNLL